LVEMLPVELTLLTLDNKGLTISNIKLYTQIYTQMKLISN